MEPIQIILLIIIFFFSFSVFLNLLLIVLFLFAAWYSVNAYKSIQRLETEMVQKDSELIITDSVNQIIDYILDLREVLFEVTEMEVYTGEPVIEELMTHVNATLDKIQNSVVSQEYSKVLDDINE